MDRPLCVSPLRWGSLILDLDLIEVGDLLTVFAPKSNLVAGAHYMEEGLHGLIVGDALRVGAAYKTFYRFGCGNGVFLDNLKVADNIDHCHWCNNRDAVDFVLFAETIVDLDDRLGTHAFALKIHAECHAVTVVFEAKYADDFE